MLHDPLTLALCGIIAIALVAAAAAFECGREFTRREIRRVTAQQRRTRQANDSDIDYILDELGRLRSMVRDNAAVCDQDRAKCKERHAEASPSPRHARTDFASPVGKTLALPAVPSVRDVIDPAWNGGTAMFDSVKALTAFERIEDDAAAVWVPDWWLAAAPVENPLHADDTAIIPVIEEITGELVTNA